jgi:hypothetical protein
MHDWPWCTPVIPASLEAEVGGSSSKTFPGKSKRSYGGDGGSLGSWLKQVSKLRALNSVPLVAKKRKKIRWAKF